MKTIFSAGLALAAAYAACAADFDVRKYGAKGDGLVKDTAALQSAIDAAEAAGGGRVVLPAGKYLTGSIYLKDNVELRLEKDAVVFGSPDKEDYNAPDVCPQNTTSKRESASGAHLILAIEKRNVAITGEGWVDGNCRAFLLGPNVVHWQTKIPWRTSQMIYFVQCDGVRLEDFRIRDAPYWSCYIFGCRDVSVRRLTVRQMRYPHTHNGDGIDIDTCERVTVEDCDIVASDDALTLRACAGRLTRPMECRDVKIRNCRLSSGCSAMRIGVGDGVIRDCSIKGLKIWRTRGAFDLVSSWSKKSPGTSFVDITIEDVELEAVRFLRMRRHHGAADRPVDGITFRNIRGTTEMPSYVWSGGLPGGDFGSVVFENVDVGHPIEIRGVKNPVITGGTLKTVSFTEKERRDNEAYYRERHMQYWHHTDGTKPNPVRVIEIADHLAEEPGFPGDHISNRARWDRKRLTGYERNCLRRAKKMFGEPVPACTVEAYILWATNRYYRSSTIPAEKRYAMGARQKNLEAFTVAECTENDGRYIPKITEYLEAIADQPSWVWAPHDRRLLSVTGKGLPIDLGCAEFVHVLAKTLDRLRGKLPEKTVARIRAEMDRRVFDPYMAQNEGGSKLQWWFLKASNWNAVCHGGVVGAALRVVEDRMKRAAFLEAAERGNRKYLLSFLDDGTCTEGQSYWNYGFGHFLDNVLLFRAFTGGKVDFAMDPVCRLAMESPKKYLISHGFAPQFGDSSGPVDTGAMRKGARVFPGFDPSLPSVLPERDFLPDAQVLICRPGEGNKAHGLHAAFKGGHNMYPHNHNDVGSYDIVLDGTRMTGDPGGVIYEKGMSGKKRYTFRLLGSYDHPVPAIGGIAQAFGKNRSARLLGKKFSAEADEIVFDLSPAYPGLEDGTVVRTFRYDRVGGVISIADVIRKAGDGTLGFPVLTDGEFKPGSGKGEWTISVGGKELAMEFNIEGVREWTTKSERVPRPALKKTVGRMEFVAKGASDTVKAVTTFRAR